MATTIGATAIPVPRLEVATSIGTTTGLLIPRFEEATSIGTRTGLLVTRFGLNTSAGATTIPPVPRFRVTTSAGTGTGVAAVDELVRYRHDRAATGVVESAVRAAAGFPTQGGGSRVTALTSRALPARGGRT